MLRNTIISIVFVVQDPAILSAPGKTSGKELATQSAHAIQLQEAPRAVLPKSLFLDTSAVQFIGRQEPIE